MAKLSVEDLLIVHQIIIAETGGSEGLRDPAMIEAIVAKPDASFGGEDLYLAVFSKTAAIYEAIVNYHVFIDGNNRTGAAVLGLYLEINGYILRASNEELEKYTLELATSHPNLADVANWIKTHSQPEPPQ